MDPQPNPNLIPGDSFFKALVYAYERAHGINVAALELAFPTLRRLVHEGDCEGRVKKGSCQTCMMDRLD